MGGNLGWQNHGHLERKGDRGEGLEEIQKKARQTLMRSGR